MLDPFQLDDELNQLYEKVKKELEAEKRRLDKSIISFNKIKSIWLSSDLIHDLPESLVTLDETIPIK